ncbi:outer membrane beta-barrel family protein [Chitinophaga nivalis]|uniref:TonB-dependent receptor family protein n=1 Tax=Chitinophaga nivalis TaxID=2991709 RepID=A0ABT3IPC1_9BACT|nr:outer membrane beta-barrel family protein [Chitinophaga nivalis]MCW3464499.1 TonB-dependent receptor family protein [Chitinophaga nivalis]MCW3485810.1 TonB-dependent receptor family protein [Chitinophaga nivalis]
MKVMWAVFLLVPACLLCTQGKAQESKIYGKVSTGQGTVPGAAVSLRSLPASILIKGTVTNDSGLYALPDIDTGKYLLSVSSMGSLPYTRELYIRAAVHLLHNVVLVQDTAKYLQGIQVTARKPFIVRAVDKTIINIEGGMYQHGENALRLFNVIPGVRVDPVSGIQFRGGQGVTVYVDNRKIHLSGSALLDYLRAIPSEAIKSYEIQAVPGAAYDAQNAGTVINITLKNNYKYGLSGSIGSSYQYTRYHEFNENAALNYRVGKVTLQASYAWYRAKQFQDNDERQHYPASDLYNTQTNRWTSRVKFSSGKFGFDYKINDRQTLGANYDFSVANFRSENNDFSAFTTGTAGKGIDSTTATGNNGINRWSNQMASIFYRNKLDSAGSKLDMGYSYIGYHNSVGNNIINNYYDATQHTRLPSDTLYIDNPLQVDIHVGNIDLEQKFGKTITLNAGGKYTYSTTNNAIRYNSGLSGTLQNLRLKSNEFLYQETIIALYASIWKDWGKWSTKLGLRTENYQYSGNSITTGETIGRNKWDLFPSLFLQRKFTDDHVLTLSAARRINRPDYRQLNPFVDVSNPYYIEKGNPFLQPYFSTSTELEYLLKGKYSFTTGYQRTTSAINTVYRHEGPVIIATDENSNNNRNVFLSMNIPVNITSWWEISSSLTLRHTTIDITGTQARRVSKLSQDLWVSNKFSLPCKYYLEVNGLYARNNFIGIYDLNPQGRIDINIRKNFLQDKLTALLNLGDPFNLYKIGWQVNETAFTRLVNRTIATRFINIGLTYNFSIGKKQTNRENVDAGGNDARGRL